MLLLVNTPKPLSKFSFISETCSVVEFADRSIMLSSPHISGLDVVNVIVDTGFTYARTSVLNNDSQEPL